jgi:hypothetical protein
VFSSYHDKNRPTGKLKTLESLYASPRKGFGCHYLLPWLAYHVMQLKFRLTLSDQESIQSRYEELHQADKQLEEG